MNKGKLQKLVTKTVALHREIAEKTEQLKALKATLVQEAKLHSKEHVQTDSGGKRWTAEGSSGCVARIVGYLREKDPAHLAYINRLPTYASNEQLGTQGAKVESYTEHLRQYVEVIRPSLLSYDHYQFANSGDSTDYFLNLSLVQEQALTAGLPFMNIVQAASRGGDRRRTPRRTARPCRRR